MWTPFLQKKLLATAFFYDFAEKAFWTRFSARSAEGFFGPLFFGAERRKLFLECLESFMFLHVFTVLGDYIFLVFLWFW